MAINSEDRLALADLVARYNHAIDHHDPESWADLFSRDGALMVDGILLAEGREALFGYVDRRRQAGGPLLRHWVTNLIVEGTADQARLRAYVMTFDIANALGAPFVMGEYDDEVIKIGGQWRFSLRRLTIVAGKQVQIR